MTSGKRNYSVDFFSGVVWKIPYWLMQKYTFMSPLEEWFSDKDVFTILYTWFTKEYCVLKILSSFSLWDSNNVSIHAERLVAHHNGDTGYFQPKYMAEVLYETLKVNLNHSIILMCFFNVYYLLTSLKYFFLNTPKQQYFMRLTSGG